ncbi:hypothetical protein BD769DRAFT_1668989 [Suillus cothurnatus]|nr:hypothetical protein BD769DRAFT_1668989 [Suillus cothurnatus]
MEVEADAVADSDDEDDSKGALEMDGSWLQKSYQVGAKRPMVAVKMLDEKNLECLLRTIHYNMCGRVKAKSSLLSFHTLPELKPNLVLMDYRLKKCDQNKKSWLDVLTGVEITISELAEDIPISLGIATKGYLIMHEQEVSSALLGPFCHSALSLDPTIHVCNSICQGTTHKNIPGGVDDIPTKVIGWVIDDIAEENQDGVECLWAVNGVPNMVQLVKYWDVEYAGCVDNTSKICNHVHNHLLDSLIFTNKIHQCMLLTPCGFLLTTFKSVPELVNVFLDLVVAHEVLMLEQAVLHGYLSPNNIIIHKGKGYFIDFDYAKFVQLYNWAKDSHGTGTIPYISCRLLKLMGSTQTPELVDHMASDDLESLFYIFLKFTTIYGGLGSLIMDRGVPPENACRWNKSYMMMDRDGLGTSGSLKKEFIMDKSPIYEPAPYFQACCPILEDWRLAIRNTLLNYKEVSHDQIHEIIQQGLDNIDSFLSPEISLPLLLMLSATPLETSVSSPAATQDPLPCHLSWINHFANSLVPSGPSSSSTPPPPPSPPVLRNHPYRSQQKKREPEAFTL